MRIASIEGLVERRISSLRAARILAVIILALGAVASLGGLLLGSPNGYALGPVGFKAVTNIFGESVSLDGHGLYRRDSVSFAAQERAQDLVTLVFGLPLLAMGFFLAGRRSHGGRLVLSGALGYFLYCYGMMSIGTAYNEFFLIYVALFAAALYAFILSVYAIDADAMAASCEAAYPRRSAAAFCIVVGLFLGFNWLGRLILPSLAQGRAPANIDGASTMFVQAFDLGILVPAAFLSAFWLLRRDRRGYLVASILIVKGAAEGLAVAAMGFNMLRVGVTESLPMILGFLALALCAILLGSKAVASAGLRGGAISAISPIDQQASR